MLTGHESVTTWMKLCIEGACQWVGLCCACVSATANLTKAEPSTSVITSCSEGKGGYPEAPEQAELGSSSNQPHYLLTDNITGQRQLANSKWVLKSFKVESSDQLALAVMQFQSIYNCAVTYPKLCSIGLCSRMKFHFLHISANSVILLLLTQGHIFMVFVHYTNTV